MGVSRVFGKGTTKFSNTRLIWRFDIDYELTVEKCTISKILLYCKSSKKRIQDLA